jgi:hypothetical protein
MSPDVDFWSDPREKIYFCERPRSPMAARGATPAGRGTSPSWRRDAGSHSVDRIVRSFIFRGVGGNMLARTVSFQGHLAKK